MMIQSIQKGRATTIVRVERIAADRPVKNDLIIGYAMHAAGEDPSSLFGWACIQHGDGTATVQLHTD